MLNDVVPAALSRRTILKGLAASGTTTVALPAIAQSRRLRIGALVPFSGGAAAIAHQMRIGIETAVAEINGTGGILGQQMEVAWRDSQITPAVLPELCRDLVEDWGAIAIVGPWVAAGRRYPNQVLAGLGVPQLYAANHEGEYCHPNLFVLGPTTAQDGRALVRHSIGPAPARPTSCSAPIRAGKTPCSVSCASPSGRSEAVSLVRR